MSTIVRKFSVFNEDGIGIALITVLIMVVCMRWISIDFYTSAVLAGVLMVLLTVPRQSIVEGVRFLQNATGAHWIWWALWVIGVVVVMNVTQYLGAPDVVVERRIHRGFPRPTWYGAGTLALFAGGMMLVIVSQYASVYRTLRRQLPFESPSSGWMTVEGMARPEDTPLQTPIEGSPAVWYSYEVTEEQDGLFQWPRLPIDSGERSIRWSVAGQTGGQKTVIDADTVRLLPTRNLAGVHREEYTLAPDEALPAGIARLEQTSASGDPTADRTTARRYRVWYVPVDEYVVAHGRLDRERPGSNELSGDGNTVSVGVGKPYDELRSQLAGRTAFGGGLGLVLSAIGSVLILIETLL